MRRMWNLAGLLQKAEGRPVDDFCDSGATEIEPFLIPSGIGLRKGAHRNETMSRILACDGTRVSTRQCRQAARAKKLVRDW